MKNATQVHVIEKGMLCGVILNGAYNLEDATYKVSMQDLHPSFTALEDDLSYPIMMMTASGICILGAG